MHAAAGAVEAFASTEASADVWQLAQAATSTQDNRGLPFAIVDKMNARVFVFGAEGTLQGASPVLLGLAQGDGSVPGIGERKLSDIRPDERTTPAGRFLSEPGINLQGEDIVWVDYSAAVSMHRVRTNNKSERRLERLASANAEDHRISYGCINVPTAFYDTYVKPVFGSARGVVYVLPEKQPARAYFSFLPEGDG
ncbi:L,D-transpeptidase [Variovorax paradoxus]|uniref:L,D-transpeptidase n=1 Tax=Variovorax paradoxus TaxID=34073 RepID=A0A6I6HQC9_VARPD|nr:L,D-transpeptidase [Variovorax paradoxus]